MQAIAGPKPVGRPNFAPPLWEIEFRVFDVIAEQTGICRSQIHRESRLLEDLNIDSLELVELILALEEEFHVTFPDDSSRLPFIHGAARVKHLAEIVRHQWGKGTTNRRRWFEKRQAPARPIVTPFTQLGGRLREREWRHKELHEPIAENYQGYAQFRRRTDGMRCVLIPAAEVELGSDAPGALADQRPRHRARISAFLIDAEPVSTTAFARFLNSVAGVSPQTVFEWCGVTDDDRRSRHFQLTGTWNDWRPVQGTEHQPIVLVSWYGAAAYSMWANGRDWRNYRSESLLPSEAQWEYAARGAAWKPFPWGDAPATLDRALVGLHTARAQYDAMLPLADVRARLGVSPFGLHHMAGNVWQWCADWYAPGFYASTEAGAENPVNLNFSGIHSERGGSWIGPGDLARSSYRRGRPPHARGRCLGFRCRGDAPAT